MALYKHIQLIIFSIFLLFFAANSSHAADATFSWTANTEPVSGYKIHYGTSSHNYTFVIDVGLPEAVNGSIAATVPGLQEGQTYYFAATAYSATEESDYSVEVVHTVPGAAPPSAEPPVATNISLHGSEDLPLSGQLSGTSADGTALQYTVVAQPSHGTVTVQDATGSFTYTPVPNYAGSDSFSYTAASSTGISAPATVTIVLDPVNDTPVATSTTISTDANTTYSGQLSATDIEGNNLSYSLVTQAAKGRAVIAANGSFTYTPNSDVSGTDSFTFKVSDGTSFSNTASVNVTINPGNSIPVDTNNYDLFVTTSSNLSGAVALDGSTVEGGIYVFTSPDTGVTGVIFSIDGVVTQTEKVAPYELAGGAAFDTSELSPGQHEITANIQLSDGSTELVSGLFTIPDVDGGSVNESLHDIYMSKFSNLSGAVPLDGATVEGDIYVFTGPDTGVTRVVFYVDGVITQTEDVAPYELAGGAAFDTSKLSPGQHEITANIQLSDGGNELISAFFTTSSGDNSSVNSSLYNILVSDSPSLSGATPLDGATVEGDIYVFTDPDIGVASVVFSVDGVIVRTERYPPFELAGGAAFNTSQLSSGTHHVTASIQLQDGSSEIVGATMIVQ